MAFFLRVDLPPIALLGADSGAEELSRIAEARNLKLHKSLEDGKRAWRFKVADQAILDTLEDVFNAHLYPEIEKYGVGQDADLIFAVDAAFARRGLKASWFIFSLDDLTGIDEPTDPQDA